MPAAARMRIHLSAACSIDGYLDDGSHRRLVPSSAEDLGDIQRERAQSDAILVGAGTLRLDNPRLTVREPALIEQRIESGLPPQPAKVVLTAGGELDPRSHFFSDGAQEKIILCPAAVAGTVRSRHGGHAIVLGIDGPISARAIAHALQRRGVGRLLVEGGGQVLSMFLSEGMYDRFRLAVTLCFVGATGAPRLRLLPGHRQDRLTVDRIRLLGDTTVIDYEPARGSRRRHAAARADAALAPLP